jgi:flagellar motor switch protein FliG
MMEPEEMPGIRKAAIMLLTIDEDMTKEIIKELDETEIEAIGHEIAKLRLIPDTVVTKVHEEFMSKLNRRNKQVVGGEQRFKAIIKKSFGDEKAEEFIGSMETKKGAPGEFLRKCDPRILANVLRGEHAQTIALVLSTLGPKKAGDAITALPENIQTDIVTRMAFLEKVDNDVLAEVENVIKEQLESVGNAEGRQLGGVEAVASILNQMDRTVETELLGKLEELNPELTERIRQLMFTFEDLQKVDDKGIQVLLKEVTSEDIGIALKGSSDAMKEKIFSNMSERAATMLKEDLETMGPVRLSDVEKAQVRIAMIAKKLEGEGKILLSIGKEQFV